MNFLGINLCAIPTWNYQKLFGDVIGAQNLILLLIPILSAITTYISVKYSMQQTPQTSDNQMQASMQKSMMWVSPIMTAFISFSVPAGLGLYWNVGSCKDAFFLWDCYGFCRIAGQSDSWLLPPTKNSWSRG